MPSPTRRDMHQSRPLQNLTVGHMQKDENFILKQTGPFTPVDHMTDTYYVYDDGAWNRMEMSPRGESEESHGSGWTLSTDSYRCDRWAVHKDFDYVTMSDADDELDLDMDAKDWLANQGRIYGDYLFGTEVFAGSKWTTDMDGTTGSPVIGTSFKQWDDSSGDPQSDILYYSEVMRGLMGEEANTMVVGAVTHARLMVADLVRTHLQYVKSPTAKTVRDFLAAYFGVDKYLVAGGYYNTAAEGATKSLSYMLDSKAAWIGYVNPEEGKRKMTSFRTFAFKDDGRATEGTVTRKMDIPIKTSVRYEIDTFWDIKIINADAGVFFDAAVA